jgi:probable F420-dependent oxidoreductase
LKALDAEDAHRVPAGFGTVGVWTTAFQWPDDPKSVRTAAQTLDELGFGTLWIAVAQSDLALQQAVLGATSRLSVATGILEIWSTPAQIVAANHQRVIGAHPGRFVLGLGSSHRPIVEALTDQAYERPLTKLRSFLDELDSAHAPVPVGERVLAALGPRALALAGQRARGAHPYLVTPDHTAWARLIMGEGSILAPEQTVVLSTDTEEARRVGRRFLAEYVDLPNYRNHLRRMGYDDVDLSGGGSNRLIDGIVAWGDLDQLQRRIDAHLDAGADHVALQLLTDDCASTLPLAGLTVLADLLSSYPSRAT